MRASSTLDARARSPSAASLDHTGSPAERTRLFCRAARRRGARRSLRHGNAMIEIASMQPTRMRVYCSTSRAARSTSPAWRLPLHAVRFGAARTSRFSSLRQHSCGQWSSWNAASRLGLFTALQPVPVLTVWASTGLRALGRVDDIVAQRTAARPARPRWDRLRCCRALHVLGHRRPNLVLVFSVPGMRTRFDLQKRRSAGADCVDESSG